MLIKDALGVEREVIDVSSSLLVTKNKNYRFILRGAFESIDLSAVWAGKEGVSPGGRVVVKFDGNTLGGSIQLEVQTSNYYRIDKRLPFLDMDVTAIPTDGAIQIYFR
jgi:hypothetical protein